MTKPPARMEFHISRQARDRYRFDESLFSLSGNVLFANFHAARAFAQKMNERRNLLTLPEQGVRSGQVNAMGLIDEILHFVVGVYREQENPFVMEQALAWLNERLTKEAVDAGLLRFVEEFPPVRVYRRELGTEEWLEATSSLPHAESVPNREIALEEMLLLWLSNANPAFIPFQELFDDTELGKHTEYKQIIAALQDFFETQPPFGPDLQNLVDMLHSPAVAIPHSLSGQLEYIRSRWGHLLGRYLYRLLSSLDFIKEEEKAYFPGPGPAQVFDFSLLDKDVERFSMDREWMPNLVLLAKNSYVWLDQMSRKYGGNITRLDEIPDEELESLSRWGFTGLWLIGLWERSPASKTIKQMRGNPEAVASAYSIFEYRIADDLGGYEAYQNLRDRAWQHGIRLASDMVPNHMGIDSPWVTYHPDRFISSPHSPFPSYTFTSPNLSWHDGVGIYLEDHYYDSTDAAVVFKRVDFGSGEERFIYHGNDGTSMPWNDTAQLNYLNPEVREAIIQTILDVARQFSVIRFDAAMTLAKRHYQRLWFPQPGTGGDIPSRAEYAMTQEQFNELFPHEFWREVVDRVAEEAPDTLLLAEAFWLMEGYFVRTLGMHRVYNSAFMIMLRDEKNQGYRSVIKNTLEFDPRILKRYVNFMNNPDERTAVDQFGKGDKYFGIAMMMVTMPGLPMFGHGQVEGFSEKYGMEYRRAYWDEHPDPHLVQRHEREIFPLMHRRSMFAEVDNFLLYDFFTPDGSVNEDVFAYSNRQDEEKALVLFHNKYATTRGWIRTSSAYADRSEDSEDRLVQKSLGDGLGLSNDPNTFTIFRDHVNGLQYIRNNTQIHNEGLYAELEAYKYRVFLDFQEVQDNEWRQYAQLVEYLGGRGVPSIDEALQEILLQPVHGPYREVVNMGFFRWLVENRVQEEEVGTGGRERALSEVEGKLLPLLLEIRQLTGGTGEPEGIALSIREEAQALLSLTALKESYDLAETQELETVQHYLREGPTGEGGMVEGSPEVWGTLLGWLFTRKLALVQGAIGYQEMSRTWIDEFLFGRILARALEDLGLEERDAWRAVATIKVMTSHQNWCFAHEPDRDRPYDALRFWLKDSEFQNYIGVNRYQGDIWFNRESFEGLLWWLFAASAVDTMARAGTPDFSSEEALDALRGCYQVIERLLEAQEQSEYRVERLLEASRG